MALLGALGGLVGVVCLLGGLYLLLATGRLRLEPLLASFHVVPGALAGPGQMQNQIPGQVTGQMPGQMQTVALEPMVVNLADPGGHAYLRLELALEVEASALSAASAAGGAEAGAKGTASLPREREILIRDTMLAVLGQQTSHALLAPGGRERLKQALLAALTAQHPEMGVHGLYFSELLVQL
jgi:flagellar basal body-associated protein FliL